MVTIGVSMIVKNEEEVLARCLDSVKGVDEIVICDTGSEDKTVEIAKRYTDKVFTDYKWNDNFAEARNHALKKNTTDWILIIDADEYLEPGAIEKLRAVIANTKERVISCKISYGHAYFYNVRAFKRDPDIFWEGAIHNHLTVVQGEIAEIIFNVTTSPSHKKDPDRSLRILKREVGKNHNPREMFYLAREYTYKHEWASAIYWYNRYLSVNSWAAQRAEANVQLAACYIKTGELLLAQRACMEAIRINANFKEACRLMSKITGPKNSARWAEFEKTANNDLVLFIRTPAEPAKKGEKGATYYDAIYKVQDNFSRYTDIYKKAGGWITGKVLDLGCGRADLRHYTADYHGFDFSAEAISKAQGAHVWVGDLYKEPLEGYDTYTALEVLEHIDDLKLVQRIPHGKQFIFSVPSFGDPAHLRTYDAKLVKSRFGAFLDVLSIIRFNWNNGWKQGGTPTKNFILLVRARRR